MKKSRVGAWKRADRKLKLLKNAYARVVMYLTAEEAKDKPYEGMRAIRVQQHNRLERIRARIERKKKVRV